MKLLLTSDGLTNKSIVNALLGLLSKSPKDNKVVFVPTASNIIAKDRTWMLDELYKFKKLGFPYIDIVDLAALSAQDWKPRLENADVLLFGGGNPFYLKYWFKKSGFAKILSDLLKDKIYIGVSASSMVLGPDFLIKPREESKKYLEKENETKGFGVVDFAVMPHFETGQFKESTIKNIASKFANSKFAIYGLDDDSAIVVNDGKVEVVSEGKWKKF